MWRHWRENEHIVYRNNVLLNSSELMESTSCWTAKKSAASRPASVTPPSSPPSCSTLDTSLIRVLSSLIDSGMMLGVMRVFSPLFGFVLCDKSSLALNQSYFCHHAGLLSRTRRTRSQCFPQTPLPTQVIPVVLLRHEALTFTARAAVQAPLLLQQKTWVSMMTLMLMCWGTTRSLL